MVPCIAFHFPPPENCGGGASATALRTASIVMRTLFGHASRNTRPGTACDASSSRWRRKKWILHGGGGGEALVFGIVGWAFTRARGKQPGDRRDPRRRGD